MRIKVFLYNTLVIFWLSSFLNIFIWSMFLSLFCVSIISLLLKGIDLIKTRVLAERLTYEDLFLYGQVFRFPKFYIPFIGIVKFWFICIFIIASFLIIFIYNCIDLFLNFDLFIFFIRVILFCLLSIFILNFAKKHEITELSDVITKKGLFLTMVIYSQSSSKKEIVCDSLDFPVNMPNHIIVVQSESFVIIDDENIKHSTELTKGKLKVPCYGAYTMRSEFMFLTGLNLSDLGANNFNPYRKKYKNISNSYIEQLKNKGYYCVAIHPSNKAFFNRNKVFEHFGFDEFICGSYFSDNDIFVSDKELFSFVKDFLLLKDDEKLFIFVITIGAHGPYSLVRKDPEEYAQNTGNHEMNTYMDLNFKAINMLNDFVEFGMQNQDDLLIWYGDHKPSISRFNFALDGMYKTNYLISNHRHNADEIGVASLLQYSLDTKQH